MPVNAASTRLRPAFTPTALALATLAALAATPAQAQNIYGYGANSYIYAISADGTSVGGSVHTGNDKVAAVGGALSGMSAIEGAGDEGRVYGLSANGSVAVGQGSFNDRRHAFRRSADGTVTDLGTLFGVGASAAYGVSGDGNVVVGYSETVTGGRRAVRWTAEGGMVNIANTNGDSYAHKTSHDGSVVVGVKTSGTVTHAFRWTEATGMVDMGSLLGSASADPYSAAYDVSADGSVIVGQSQASSGELEYTPRRAFRWTQATGMVDLGTLGGGNSQAQAVSANGAVTVGRAQAEAGQDAAYLAFRWSQATGMQSIADWLAAAGVGSGGWSFDSAMATNADGSIVVGHGSNNGVEESWLARVSDIGTGVMKPANYSRSLSALTESFHHAQSLTRMILWGSHHRPLMSYGQAGQLTPQNCFWATGDLGSHQSGRNSDERLAEVGVCRDFAGGAVRAGVGLGYSRQSQSLGEFGRNRLTGHHLVGEVNWQVPAGPQLSATAVAGDWKADIRRGYAGATGTDYSTGHTDVSSAALRLRADWIDAWTLGQTALTSLTPYAALTTTRTTNKGYTETGGGFPARFEGQKHSALEGRVGLAGGHVLNASTRLRGSLEAAHRFDGRGPSMAGQSLGLFSFNEKGASTRKTWARAGVDLDHQLGKNTLVSVSVHAATQGEDPTLSGAVSLRIGF